MTRTQSREMRLGSVLYACVLFATGVGPVSRMHAQGLKVSSGDQLDRLTQRLRPGQAVFAPNIEPEGSIVIHIDLTRQVLTVYRNGIPIGVSTISSGRRGYGTPTGTFSILMKDVKHRSNKYYNAPMPYTQRFTEDGAAMHAGGVPGYPESHGCVHLPLGFARQLYGITSIGETVIVEGNAFSRRKTFKPPPPTPPPTQPTASPTPPTAPPTTPPALPISGDSPPSRRGPPT
jgi:hypothetical protein